MTDIKKKILINGLMQKIHIRTLSMQNPVLLFLHGGPGVVNRHAVFSGKVNLCEYFTVVTWDQRGSGGSYKDAKADTLNVKQFIEDAHFLSLYLCETFKKDKIFVIGGSWGSALGTMLCYYYPGNIAGFVGFGQVVNGEKNEELSYKFACEEATRAGDSKSLRTLKRIGAPVKGLYKGGFSGMMAQRKIMMKYGGYSIKEGKQSYLSATALPMIFSGEYSLSDLWGVLKGYKNVLKTMWKEVAALNFTTDFINFKVPIFIFDGKLDMNTPSELVEDWFNKINAPQKELIWFYDSGHNPLSDENEKFTGLLIDRLYKIKEREANV